MVFGRFHHVWRLSCRNVHLPLSKLLDLLERVSYVIILTHPVLPPLLADNMFDHRLLRLGLEKLANEPRVPEFTSHAQVLTAPHKCIRFAALCRCWNSIWIEILLLATSNGY